MFRIYYSDRTISGETREDWINAPDDDVQVVVLYREPTYPLPDRHKTGYVHACIEGRMLFTGVDEYDPMETGHVKKGRLLSDAQYWALWERARGHS